MRKGSISAGYAGGTSQDNCCPANVRKKLKFYQKSLKVWKKKKTRVFSGSEVIQLRDPVDYYFVLKLCLHKIMPGPNGFNVSLFQRNNAVKNLMCMASQSIENIWWFENIVFHVLFFNQLCPSKKAKTFDWHTSVLSQLECSVCYLFGQNSDPLPPSFPNNPNFFILKPLDGQTLNLSETLSNGEHGMRCLHHRSRSSENSSVDFV